MPVHQILLVFALCCFTFAAWQNAHPYWNRVVAVGLAFFTLAALL